jgi:hypothetical protein
MVPLGIAHRGRGARPSPAGPAGDRPHQIQVAPQLIAGRRLRFDLALRL